MTPTPAQAIAEEALRVAEADPTRAFELAGHATRAARADHDVAALAVAERARGLAAVHQHDLDMAVRHLRRSVALALGGALTRVAAEARMTLAYALNLRGRAPQALREIDIAVQNLDHVHGARARAQRGAILHQVGRLDEALAAYREALPALRRAGDKLWIQRVVLNRGVLHGQRQEFTAATADLLEAVAICRELDLDLQVGYAYANLGYVESLRGDVPTALSHFDEAERVIGGLRAQLGPLLTDRTDLLLSSLLISEARETAARAVAEFERTRALLGLPEVRLLLARAAALEGDPALALTQAERAVREFQRQGRREWAALARLAVLTIRHRSGSSRRNALAAVERATEALPPARWPAAALEGRLLAADLARAAGRRDRASVHLTAAAGAHRRGPAFLRARGWYAEALHRYVRQDPGGATRAIRAGLAVLDDHAAAFGATDLRAYAAGHRTDLADLGLRIAFERGHPLGIWVWSELGRAAHLLLRPARPPDDETLAGDLAELRTVAVEILQLRKAGGPTAAAVQRQVALERRIRDHMRSARRDPAPHPDPTPSAGLVGRTLGDAALLQFVVFDGRLHAVTMVDGTCRLHPLATMREVTEIVRRLPFGLGRLASSRTSVADHAAALALVVDAGQRLDRLLLAGLPEIADRPLVIVPSGPLVSLPWAVLPSCRGRSLTVAPSAMLWARAAGVAAGAPTHAAVAAGPGLPGGESEATEVADIYGGKALTGPAATVDAVTTAMDGAGLAHLAAHASAHPHNPLFSSLRFADGPLMIYDLERLGSVPRTVVLAACNSGRGVVTAGNQVLGLSATFLSLGATQVIASVLPVLDVQTAPLMAAFHRRLVAGAPAATALAAAHHDARGDDRVMAMTAGFVCIGAGLGGS